MAVYQLAKLLALFVVPEIRHRPRSLGCEVRICTSLEKPTDPLLRYAPDGIHQQPERCLVVVIVFIDGRALFDHDLGDLKEGPSGGWIMYKSPDCSRSDAPKVKVLQ